MKSRIIFKLAFKNLWSHKLRTSLTVAGVAIGTSSIIFLVSLGYGLEKLVTEQVANFNAFTVIDVPSASVSTIKIDDAAIEKISAFAHITTVAPVMNLAGRIRKIDNSSTAETVISGADTNYWNLSSVLADKGKLPENENEVAINQSVISLIGEKPDSLIGKKINLDIIIPAEMRTNETDGIKVAESVPFTISGILSDNKSPVVLVSKKVLNANDAVKYSSLKLKVDNKDNVSTTRKQLENLGYATEYVGDTVSQISQVFALFRAILAAFGLVALVVAALGTFNTLTISLLERIREIGLFKALGMKNKDVYKLFITESLLIGIFGGILGMIFGWSIGLIINQILSFLASKSNAEKISLFITPWFFAFAIATFSVVVGFLTGWYPSKRAVKIDPLDALKYE